MPKKSKPCGGACNEFGLDCTKLKCTCACHVEDRGITLVKKLIEASKERLRNRKSEAPPGVSQWLSAGTKYEYAAYHFPRAHKDWLKLTKYMVDHPNERFFQSLSNCFRERGAYLVWQDEPAKEGQRDSFYDEEG